MEILKLCEIITSGDYGSMTDLTDNQRKFVIFIYGFVDEMKLRVKYAEH